MPLLDKSAANSESSELAAEPVDFALAGQLYRDGAYAESYCLYSALERKNAQSPALCVNLALCHMQAEEWQSALILLDKALVLQKRQIDANKRTVADERYKKLFVKQAQEDSYRQPMAMAASTLLPAYAKDCILRLQIDVCVALSLWARILTSGGVLAGKGYPQVDDALTLARKNSGLDT